MRDGISTLTKRQAEIMMVPVTDGQRYWIVIDGYNNASATGNARIGASNGWTNTNERMIFTNDAGAYFGTVGSAIALRLEAEALVSPVPTLSEYALWLLGIGLAGIGVFMLRRSAVLPADSRV